MKENIVFTGFMGTGKSAIGKRLAVQLNLNFIDTDCEVEDATGLKLPDIFRKYGEKRFRAEEQIAVQKASTRSRAVIATGGGVVLNRDSMAAIRQKGLIILLEARPEVIAQRIRRHDVRPLLNKNNQMESQIQLLLQERAPYYAEADLKIETSDLSFEQIIDWIISYLKLIGWDFEGVAEDGNLSG